ncbi:MAG: PAS domain S-box protein [Proteobacteria bacterium]|nr:PAS domain S-box protein [Pseudomonadota bacterium]
MARAAEPALRELAQYRAMWETVVDGIISIDEQGTVIALNPAAERIFGYSAAEVVGNNVKMLMPEPYHGQHDNYLANYRRSGEAKIIGTGREVEGKRKDGSIFPLHLSVAKMEVNGEVCYNGVLRDLTDSRAAEAELAESQRRYHDVLERSGLKAAQPKSFLLGKGIKKPAFWKFMLEDRQFDERHLYTLALLMTGLPVLVGLMMVGAWLWPGDALRLAVPWIFYMQLKTAVLYSLCGLGLSLVLWGRGAYAFPVAAFVGAVAGATLLEYGLGMSLGIDPWLAGDLVYDMNAYPGRMAPNTAAVLLTTAVVLALLASPEKIYQRLRVVAVDFLSFMVLAIGVAVLAGYIRGEPMVYTWGSMTRMSIPTAVATLVLAMAVMATSSYHQRMGVARGLWWIPPILALLVFMFDLAMPLGVAAGIAYVPLVFCGLWFRRLHMTFVLAMMGTLLTIMGYMFSPAGPYGNWIVLTNRTLTVGTLWLVAVLVYLHQRIYRTLADSELRFKNLYNHTPVMLFSTNEDNELVGVSNHWLDMMGYTRDEVLGRKITDFMSEEAARVARETTLPRFKAKGTLKDAVSVMARSDGTPMEVMISAITEKDQKGRYVRSLAVMVDTTQKNRSEKMLREYANKLSQQNISLARSNQELENFAYITSHDLQEPLRMVRSYGDLLRDRYMKALPDEAREFLGYMVNGAERMQNLIRDLLAYSRVSRNEMKLSEVDFASVVEEVKRTLGSDLTPVGASIKVSSGLPKVAGEKGMLMQVMQNLLTNAVKFRKAEGPLEVEVSARKDGEKWEFAVRDNGIGIDPRHGERVFEMFKRLHSREEYEGTGIGLAVCKKVVERHGGEIWVDSELGRGATFYFTLPEQQPMKEEPNDEGK